MDLKDYSTEELRAELRRRSDLVKAEKAKVKKCKMCKHWGEINYFGESPKNGILYGFNRCCKFFKHKTGKYYHAHSPSQLACEYFEEKEKTL